MGEWKGQSVNYFIAEAPEAEVCIIALKVYIQTLIVLWQSAATRRVQFHG